MDRRSLQQMGQSLVGAQLAAGVMLIVSPAQDRMLAFLLWTVFFAVLLVPPSRCRGAVRS